MTSLANLLPLIAASAGAVKQSQSGNGKSLPIPESVDQSEPFAMMFAELQNFPAIPLASEEKQGNFKQSNILALLSPTANKSIDAETSELLNLDMQLTLQTSPLPAQIVNLMAGTLDLEQAAPLSEQVLSQNTELQIEAPQVNAAQIPLPQPIMEIPANALFAAVQITPATKPSADLAAQTGDLQSDIEQNPQQVLNNTPQSAIPANPSNSKPVAAEKAEAAGLPSNASKEGGPATILADSFSEDRATSDDNNQRQSPATAREMKVTVIRQETHFAPPFQTSLAQQITDRIAGQLEKPIASSTSEMPGKPSASSVKVLQIQLAPPDLGMLTMRMSLKADVLNLHLQVAQAQTAALIQNDREALTGLLRSAGYMVDGLQIQVTPSEKGSGGQSLSSGNDSFQPGQSHSGGDKTNNGMAGQSSRQRNNENYNVREGDAQAESRHNRPNGDAVYI